MAAYILRRLLLMVPTLFVIMVLNFTIVQFAPGGPVEQMIAQLQGTATGATAQISGTGGGDTGTGGTVKPAAGEAPATANIAAPATSIPRPSPKSNACSASINRCMSGFG